MCHILIRHQQDGLFPRITSDIRNLGHTLSWHIVDLSYKSDDDNDVVFMFILN